LDLLWRSMTHRGPGGRAKSMQEIFDEHQNSRAIDRRSHADTRDAIAAAAERSLLGITPNMPVVPRPTTTAAAEVTKRTIEQKTQRSELILRVDGAAQVVGRPVPGVTVVPHTGGF